MPTSVLMSPYLFKIKIQLMNKFQNHKTINLFSNRKIVLQKLCQNRNYEEKTLNNRKKR